MWVLDCHITIGPYGFHKHDRPCFTNTVHNHQSVAVVPQIRSIIATGFLLSHYVVWRECCILYWVNMDGFIGFSFPYASLLNLATCKKAYCKHIKSIHTLVAWKYVATCCHPPLCPTHSYCRDCSPAWSSKQHYDIKYSLLLVSFPGLHHFHHREQCLSDPCHMQWHWVVSDRQKNFEALSCNVLGAGALTRQCHKACYFEWLMQSCVSTFFFFLVTDATRCHCMYQALPGLFSPCLHTGSDQILEGSQDLGMKLTQRRCTNRPLVVARLHTHDAQLGY